MKRAARITRGGQGGVALLVTLMMVSVLTMMVVGLAGVMRNEQAAARNLTYQVLAEQVAEIGVAEAMAVVLSNSPTGNIPPFTATGPGWMFRDRQQPPVAPLFSTNTSAGVKNLEMFGTNSMILSLPVSTPRVDGFVAAGWVPLFRPNETNAFARYAWWVDDEASKLNLNLTGSNDPSLAALSTRTPFATNWVFVNPTSGVAFTPFTNRLAFRTNVFWSAESVKDLGVYGGNNTNMPLTAAQYRQIKGNITAWSAVRDDLTPWGAPKFNLADLTNLVLYPSATSAVASLKAALMTNGLTNLFGPGVNLGKKYGGGSVTATNPGNHGDLVVEQIAKNIMAAQGRPFVCTNFGGRRDNLGATHPNRHRNGLPREIASHYQGPYLEEVRVRVDGTIAGGASITGRLGILVQVVNPYNQTFSNFTLVVLPRKFRFQTIPAPGQTGLGSTNIINQTSLAPLNGFVGPSDFQSDPNSGPGWYIGPEWFGTSIVPWPTNNTFTAVINSIGPKTRLSFPFEQRISFALGDNKRAQGLGSAYVILDSVKLCRGLNNFTDVIDWVSLDDFSQPGNYENSRSGALSDIGQLNLTASTVATLTTLNAANFGGLGGNVLGLRRIDPQARWPVPFWSTNNRGLMKENAGWPDTVQAWTRNANLPVGSLVTNTGIPYLQADPAPGLLDITNHPHFVSGFYVTNGLTSMAQLGAIHTGIPWRTLRLQPTPALELAQGPPDWTLLEVFTLSGSSGARPMFNVNSAMLGMVRSGNQWAPGLVTNSLGQIQARPWAFLGALGPVGTNLTSANTNRAISNGIPVSMTNGAFANPVMTNLAGNLTNALVAPTNPAVWSVNSGWGGYRAANTNRFPPRGLLLRGELLEVRGLAEDTNATATAGEDLREGRLRLFLDMMTTRSDTFSVWSVGQGLSVFTNARGRIQTNVMGEVRQQTVFQRVPVVQNGVTQEYRLERLYSRTHTLEELAAEDLR